MLFEQLLAQHAATGLARQLALGELIGERDWQLDIASGTVTFGGDLRYRIQILGTESHEDQTWLWAWANAESNIPPGLLHLCEWMREYGRRAAVPELTEATFPLQRADGHRLALVASGLTGRCYYRGPYPGGAVFFHLDDAPAQISTPVRPERVLTVLTEVLQGLPVDHRTAVPAFLHQQGWQVGQDGPSITARHPGGSTMRVDFDAYGRVGNMTGSITG